MNKTDIISALVDEVGMLYGLKKNHLEHILKEYETVLINGLERDGEVSLLNFGKLVIEIKKPRTVASKFIKEGVKELPERGAIELNPGKLVRALVADGNFDAMRTRVRTRKRPKI